MNINTITKRHLRPPAAAEYIGFSQSKLAKLRVLGGGPIFIKAGRLVLYDIDDLNAWLAERRRTSTSDRGEAPRHVGNRTRQSADASQIRRGRHE